jgi:hypothetical protein
MRRFEVQTFLLGMVCVCVVFTAGCGGGPKTYPVSGKATVDGQPLTDFVVTFVPNAQKGNTAEVDCSARLGQDGQYTLQTDDRYKVYKGAPPGWYKVSIWSTEDKQVPINKKFLEPKTALEIEVVSDAPPGHYDLKFTK